MISVIFWVYKFGIDLGFIERTWNTKMNEDMPWVNLTQEEEIIQGYNTALKEVKERF